MLDEEIQGKEIGAGHTLATILKCDSRDDVRIVVLDRIVPIKGTLGGTIQCGCSVVSLDSAWGGLKSRKSERMPADGGAMLIGM